MTGLTFTQQAICDFLAARADWTSGRDILRNVFTPRHDIRNVRVQIFHAKRKGAPIESYGAGPNSLGYRWRGAHR